MEDLSAVLLRQIKAERRPRHLHPVRWYNAR